MTKTKSQLRAEAVKRLKELRGDIPSTLILKSLYTQYNPFVDNDLHMLRDALIDLLTDDAPESHGDAQRDVLSSNTDTDKGEGAKAAQTARECADSREKLEADAVAYCDHFLCTHQRFNETKLIELLDRQAAITRAEMAVVDWWTDENGDTHAIAANGEEVCHYAKGEHAEAVNKEIAELEAENAELQAKVDELQAELDTKQGALDIAVKNESNLEQRIIELEKDNDRLMQKVADAKVGAIGCQAYNPETHYCKWHCADFELNDSTLRKLRRENTDLKAERDMYRDKLGRAIDKAHEIARMVDE